MNPSATTRWRLLVPLLGLTGMLLTSCRTYFDERDQAFGRAAQQRLAADFQKQASILTAAEKHLPTVGEPAKIPAGFAPWWAKGVGDKLFADAKPSPHGLEDLFTRALTHSTQVRVFRDVPLIRHTGIREARGEFDTHLFAEAKYEYTDEPVGSTLRTGGPNRFRQHETTVEAGLRKRLRTGADVTLSQKIARTRNNSIYFVPNPQASARLALTVTQPLLKGAGIKYNRSIIRIAKIDSEIARHEFIRQTESHLLQIAKAYWTLYLSRALCVQKQKLVTDTAALVAKLEKRKDLDALQSQLMSARSALAKRKADVVRTEMAVKNTEDRIRALINDPTFSSSAMMELLPADAPSFEAVPVDMKQCAATALENRDEITQAFLQLKSAAIRKNVAKNEILPQLDLLLSAAIAGLEKAGAITEALDDQWHHPGFMVGLRFDYPLENNAAKARLRRRRLELRQQLAQLRTTVDTVLLEVRIGAREAATSHREVLSRYQSFQAAQEDLRILQQRWDSHAGAGNKPAIGYIQLLIDAQDRMAQAEENLARSMAQYNVSMVNLQRAQGTLLKYEDAERLIEEGMEVDDEPAEMAAAGDGPPPAPKPAPKTVLKPAPKPTPKATVKLRPKTVMKPAPKPVAKPAPKLVAKPAPKPAPKLVAKPAPKPAPGGGSYYAAEGILARSELFADRYVLRAPNTRIIVTFVTCTDQSVKLANYVGKHIRAIGTRKTNGDTLLVSQIVVVPSKEG